MKDEDELADYEDEEGSKVNKIDPLVFYHYVGSTAESTDLARFFKSCIGQLRGDEKSNIQGILWMIYSKIKRSSSSVIF